MDYPKELEFAKALALDAGKIMLDAFRSGLTREWKEDGTPLTYADTTINTLVIEKVSERFPEDGVLGEEESSQLGAHRMWVCDPVDGTMAFSHGLPISTFSIALTIDGKPVMGVIYDPFMDRLFWGAKGTGAFLNGKKLQVLSTGFENALIDIAGFPGSKAVVDPGPEFRESVLQTGAHVSMLWSIIISSALVADGQYTATVFNVPKPEDGAAVKVIVEEAGGKVTDLFGNEQRYDRPTKGMIVSNGIVHDELVKLVKEHNARHGD